VDRADFNGFWNYIEDDTPICSTCTSFVPGVYSANDYFPKSFGSAVGEEYQPYSTDAVDDSIPNTWQWVYEPSETSITPAPAGGCISSTCAGWFGGVAADREIGWQWVESQDDNGVGDFDSFDASNL
jgi:hypothetical protein